MTPGIAAHRAHFGDAAALAVYNAALEAAGLGRLAGLRGTRAELRGAAAYPLLAVELGRVAGRREGAAGLRSQRARVTLTLAVGAEDSARLDELVPAYLDALRAAVEEQLAAPFTFLTYAAAQAEGEDWSDRGICLRRAALMFDVVWLYQIEPREGVNP